MLLPSTRLQLTRRCMKPWIPRIQSIWFRSYSTTPSLYLREQTSTMQAPPGQRGNPLAGASDYNVDHMHSSEPFYQDHFNVETFFMPSRPKRPRRHRAIDQPEHHITELDQGPSEVYKHHPMLSSAFDWSPFLHPDELPEMKVDIEELENEYVIHAEVPGVQKKDIHLHVHGNYITIRAEKKMLTTSDGGVVDQRAAQTGASPARGEPTPDDIPSSASPTASEEAVAADKVDAPLPKYHRRTERTYGLVQRTFQLPNDSVPEQIKATYDAGVLTITVPRTQQQAEKLGKEVNIL